MEVTASNTKTIALENYGITNAKVFYQFSSDALQQITRDKQQGVVVKSGALAINTGKFTGRSPKDRFIVIDNETRERVHWGDVNIPFDSVKYQGLKRKIQTYLSDRLLYVRDAFAGAHKDHRLAVRIVNEHPWANLFAGNMFIEPTADELDDFNEDWLLLHAPGFKANPAVDGTRSENFAIINFMDRTILTGGTAYTGELKKSVFSVLNYLLPKEDVLPMHCAVNVGEDEDTAVFFGLSGTGKTTLSTDSSRKLVGDDEHGWTSGHEVYNFEGGCYAKVINLSPEKEPEIFKSIKKGALLENIVIDAKGEVDFQDSSITQNTRVSYPLHHIDNRMEPAITAAPKNIFFLTADAFGVLPPVSKLTPEQAAYHFISGYTSKVAGTETGVKEPKPHFSACFGAPFMPLHPVHYAQMLQDRIEEAGTDVWMINTGWTGGAYGVGERMPLKYTRTMIRAVLAGKFGGINKEDYHMHSVFGLAHPRKCPGIPEEILHPRKTWSDEEAYYEAAHKLAAAFKANFRKYEKVAGSAILAGQPLLG